MKTLQIVAESLGDSSYLVIGSGSAAAVDPQRDVRPLLKAARDHGVTIDFVFETHVHNDYLSGGRELAALGARVVVPANSGIEFPHLPLADGAEVTFGGGALRALSAPGHTYEHTAYLGVDEKGRLESVFSGGALLMGSAGRSDLLGPSETEQLTRLQWESAQRIARTLPQSGMVFPTHGAGSFCSTTGSALERSGPLAIELARNPALTSEDAGTFRAIQLASSAPIPGYYRHMAPINRRGPKVFGEPPRPRLISASEIFDGATAVLDIRTRQDFANGHAPESLEIEESNSLLAYVGWLLPFNAPLSLICYDEAQARRVTVDLFRIGYEDVRGYLPWADWAAGSRPVESLPTVGAEEARQILKSGSMPVLDTRFSDEQLQLPLPGALERPMDQLTAWLPEAPQRSLIVCASGQRATMAASFLKQAGKEAIAFIDGGALDLLS